MPHGALILTASSLEQAALGVDQQAQQLSISPGYSDVLKSARHTRLCTHPGRHFRFGSFASHCPPMGLIFFGALLQAAGPPCFTGRESRVLRLCPHPSLLGQGLKPHSAHPPSHSALCYFPPSQGSPRSSALGSHLIFTPPSYSHLYFGAEHSRTGVLGYLCLTSS